MKSAYRAIAYLIAAAVAVQASSIALAWFTVLSEVEDGTSFTKDSDFNTGHLVHSITALVVLGLMIALLVTSFFTRVQGASKRAGLVALSIVVQVALAIVAFGLPAVGALHGLNAMVVLATALYAGRQMHKTIQAGAAQPATAAAVPAQRQDVATESSPV